MLGGWKRRDGRLGGGTGGGADCFGSAGGPGEATGDPGGGAFGGEAFGIPGGLGAEGGGATGGFRFGGSGGGPWDIAAGPLPAGVFIS